PMRSVVYRFGADAAMMDSAAAVAADALLLDLEDSVAAEHKNAARARVVAALDAGGFRAPVVLVRVNGIGTRWLDDDLGALAGLRFDGVMLPKSDSAAALAALAARADAAGVRSDVAFWAMIETPAG